MERELPAYDSFTWSLWNERVGLQIDGLSFTHAWLFIATIERRDWVYWKLWHDGLTRWNLLLDFEETSYIISEVMKFKTDYPFIPGEEERAKAAEESAIHTFELEDARDGMKIDSANFKDNRAFRRYNRRFPLLIDIDGVPFHTHTLDISMGGMRINDALPSTFSETFDANLQKSDGSLLTLKCLVIKRTNAPLDRIRFLLDTETEAELRTWLLSTPEDET